MKYLGVDFGLKRIGLAASEGELASPWQVIEINNTNDGLSKIFKVIKEEVFEKVIVGQPEGKIGLVVGKFIQGLKNSGFDVDSIDEHLTTRDATSLMLKMGIPKKKRQVNDAYSAALILQSYLDSK